MNAFALARSKARLQRESIGTAFRSAYDLVAQALAEEGYGIQLVPQDGVLLNGDEAQLRRDFSLVLIRDDVGEDEQALLAAHELGHLVLHRPHECCELGQSEVGTGSRALSRVETYGPRERRELQANVFAREFLLPRQLARRLFVDEKLPASDIAKRTGMPLPEVRRQILDSLLRPDEQPASEPSAPSVVKLDPSQQKAVDFNGRAMLVEAGPGSGKTRTLVARIERRLADGIHPSAILALTFSNKAAAELSERITARRPDDAVEVWTGTFHAFGLEVMRQHYDRMGLAPGIRLLSPSQAVEMLEEYLPVLGLRHFHDLRNPGSKLKEILKPIYRAKDELVGPERFRELAERGLKVAADLLSKTRTARERTAAEKDVEAAEKTLEAASVYEVYERALRKTGCVDFSDLVMRPTLLMEADEAVRNALRDRYREVLVDEYQDVNRACARMLKALHGPDITLWVVGDARQSIYRFRGASSLNMGRFETDFEGAERTPLEWNYRSTEHITGLCRTFAAAMDRRQAADGSLSGERLPYLAQAKRKEAGSQTRLNVGLNDECEADLVAREIQALQAEGVPLGHQTILARTNARLDTLASQFAARGIPVLHLGSFFEREEVRDLLSILALVSEQNGAALVRIAALREIDVHADDISVILSQARNQDVPLLGVLPTAGGVPGLTGEGSASLARLGRRLAGMAAHTPAFEVAATWLLEKSDYLRDLSNAVGIEADLSRAALWQIIEFLDQTEPDGRPLSAKEGLRRVRTVIVMADDRDLREPGLGADVDAVRLMTVHAAKGLEFKAVHIVGLHENNFPFAYRTNVCQHPPGIEDGRDPREAHAEEEDCAFYVAISRAEDHLRLYHTGMAAKQRRKPSRFLDDLGPMPGERMDEPLFARAPTIRDADAIDVEVLTLHDIRDYDNCPLKVAYRHRMSVRSRRYEGPFLQASGVLYEILDRVSEIAASGATVPAAILAALDEVWGERGPVGHSLEEEYRALVRASLDGLAKLLDGFGGLPQRTVRVPIAGGQVIVPAPLLSSPDHVGRVARYVELGRADPKEAKALRAGMLHAAALLAMEERTAVEVAFLTGGDIILVTRTDDEAAADLASAAEILATIRSGSLEPRPNMRVCVRCAHFFSCPATGAKRVR